MINRSRIFFGARCCLALLLPLSLLCAGQENAVDFQLKVRGSYYLEGANGTLQPEDIDAATLLLQPKLDWSINQNWHLFGLAELFAASDFVTLDEEYATDRSDGYLAFRELWMDYQGFGRYPGESLRFGTERMKEDSGLWWDREALLLRWRMDTTLVRSTLGLGQRIDFLRTDDSKLLANDKDRLSAFYSYERQWHLNHWIGGRLLYSGDKASDDNHMLDLFERRYIWAGLTANNAYFDDVDLPWQYDIEVIKLTGNARSADALDNEMDVDVSGWAMDLGLRAKLIPAYALWGGIHYAYASGGNDDSTDTTFYQSNLYTNRSRFANTAAKYSRFGEVARIEWSNLNILTAYLTHKVNREFEWTLVAHQFALADKDARARLAGSYTRTGGGEDIGSEVDLMLGYFSSTRTGLLGNFSAQFRAGLFSVDDDMLLDMAEDKYKVVLDVQKRF